MNILHTQTLFKWGGEQNKTINEMLSAREMGHQVYLLANPGSRIVEKARELGFTTFEVPMRKTTYFSSIPRVIRLIKEQRIDLIVTHSSTDSWVGAIAGKLSSRKPVLVREKHNTHPIRGFLSRYLHTHIFDYIFAVGITVRNMMVGLGVPKNRIYILRSVVDIDKFQSVQSGIREELGIPQSAFVMGIFTSLRPNKGALDFAKAGMKVLKEAPNAWLIFGGKCSPDLQEEILELYRRENIDPERVKFTGFRTDAANVMKGFDVYVYPSYFNEGVGTAITEAIICKLPVVIYEKTPMAEIVQNNITGFTVPFRDTEAVAQKVLELSRNPQQRKTMGKAGYEFVAWKFSKANMPLNIEKFLKQAVNRQLLELVDPAEG